MNIFNEFEDLFVVNGKITIVYEQDNNKIFCYSKIKAITEEGIFVEPDDGAAVDIPKDKILSVIYSTEHGLYGFHTSILHSSEDRPDALMHFYKPKEGWRIQRRKAIRFELIKEGFFHLAELKDDNIVPEDETHSCLVYNVGHGGVGFQSDIELKIGQHLVIDLEIENKKIKEECVVAWAAEIPAEHRIQQYNFLYGVRFLLATNELKKIIEAFEK